MSRPIPSRGSSHGRQNRGEHGVAATAPEAEFAEALNRHGFAFQQAVLQHVIEMHRNGRSEWAFEVAEFPVAIGDSATHVDFVLRAASESAFLVGECKRVDPAMGRWCFARSPFTRRSGARDETILEELGQQHSSRLVSSPVRGSWGAAPYQIAVEVKTKTTGDQSGGGRDTIDKAVAQVLRGVSGLVDHWAAKDWSNRQGVKCRFIPAVFTTAEIWTTDADLSRAELTSGRLGRDEFRASSAGWLWYNHNLSPHLRHGVSSNRSKDTLSEALAAEATRSVAIVSPSGLDEFLNLRFD